jgi:hypothetical protein
MLQSSGQEEEFTRFKDRRVKYEAKRSELVLSEIKSGDSVDVRDTEYIWCSASVELVINSKDKAPLLYINYEGWNRKYDEYIYMNSPRIAKFGSYTQRQDIPRYQSGGRV